MSLLFANLAYWPLALLVAVPVLLHLFARSRPPPYPFPTVALLQRLVRATLRLKRPQDWLVLALRVLLVLTLVLVFLRPLFFTHRRLAGFLQQKHVVLLVDASASMAWTEGGRTRFAAACAEAAEYLSGLSGNDTANLVWLKAAPAAVFPEMGSNLAYLREALRRAGVTTETADVETAVALAVKLLKDCPGRREICIVSDFQTTAWRGVQVRLPGDIDLVKLQVGRSPAANVALTGLTALPGRPLRGEDAVLQCQIENFSPDPVQKTVFLSLGESRQTQPVHLPAWGKATASFRCACPSAGDVPVAAAIDEDAFPGDDRRWAVLTVHDFLRVGLAHAPGPTAPAWRRAVRALPWARLDELGASDLHAEGLDAVLMPGWDGRQTPALRAALTGGCTVLCEPAPGVAAGAVPALLTDAGPARGAAAVWEQPRDPLRLELAKRDDVLFAVFADGEFGDPARGAYGGRLRLDPTPLAGGETLLRYADGVPALVRFHGSGALFLWNLSLDPQFSGLAQRPEFVTLMGELLLTGRTHDVGRGRQTDFLPGEPVVLSPGRELAPAEVTLTDEAGTATPLRPTGPAGRDLRAAATLAPGLYVWRQQGEWREYSTVNFPTSESDLRTLTPAELDTPGCVAVIGGAKARDLRDGVPLWPWLLAGAVVLALSEGLVLLWTARP